MQSKRFVKPTLVAMLLLLVSGCGIGKRESVNSLAGYCDITEQLVYDHVDALLEDGGDRSVVTGDEYVTVRDRVCEEARDG